ncbi:MAG: dihydrodipicolinate synthase family protein [Armatimonadetes bacterium]|nr:dihydrodipicolinate synthase family protein [Armatimonadota bacterium]
MAGLDRVIVPLVTPYTDDASTLSEVRLVRLVRFHRDAGAQGYLVGAEASEGFSVSVPERKQVLEWVVREVVGEPVYVNVSAMTTSTMIDLAQHAERHGARAVVFRAPPHVRLTEQETLNLVAAVRRHGHLPAAFFGSVDVPDESSSVFPVKSLAEAGCEDICLYDGLSIDEFSHGEDTATPFGVLGPDFCLVLQQRWSELHVRAKALFKHARSHRVGKAVMRARGVDVGCTRGPIADLDQQSQQLLDQLVAELS